MRLVLPIRPIAWLAIAGSVAGCALRSGPPATVARPAAAEASLVPAPVGDEDFAGTVQKLLRDGKPSPARTALLAGVVGRQIEHARERFEARHPDRGLAALTGALYLMRAGEIRREMIANGDPVLAVALAEVAPRGDEGRALALLTLRHAVLPEGSPARHDVDEHVAALADWMRDTHTGGALEAVGRAQRAQAARALLEPTKEALTAARDVTVAWIERAVAFNQDQKPGAGRPKREEAVEAFRAFRSGAETLAALHLRHGDAQAAYEDIERTSARRIVSPLLYERLERASSGGDAAAWRDLLGALLDPQRGGLGGRGPESAEDPEIAIDPDVLRAAVWGTALEAYRRDPTAMEAAMPLAAMLVQLGMSEVAPLALADAVGARPDPATAGAALDMTLQAIVREDDAEDTPSARRTYAAAAPLVAAASRPEVAGRVRPSPARVWLVMGTIETRAGNLAAARPLLEASAAADPTVDAYLALGAIARQSGDVAGALAHLGRALQTAESQRDPASAAEAHLSAFDLHLEARAADKARPELAAALGAALDARQRARDAGLKARAERLLARVLERYSDLPGAARATERAFAASGRDKQQLAATVLDAAARAFVRRDAKAARAAVERALSAELRDDDLVYAALWLALVEKDLKTPPDGTAARALSTIKDDGHWSGRLAAWGLGKVKDADLIASARTPGQKTEALFYTAVSKRVAGDLAGSEEGLRGVLRSTTIDLVEVQLARDLLAGPQRTMPGPPPAGTAIP